MTPHTEAMSQTEASAAELQALLETAVQAALQAGGLVHEKIGQDLEIRFKEQGVQNLVTEMDTAAETLIKEIIESRHGPSTFLGEEFGGNPELRELTWVIDPIDGTVNYAHGVPIYCVSIGAVRNDQPLVGVIYNPNTSEMFTAIKGGGAYLNGKRLKVSANGELLKAILVTGFPYNVMENPFGCIDAFVDFLRMGVPVRRLGSAALDLAYTAAGRFDAYWEVALNYWDVAAGILMVLEAGGMVTTYASEVSSDSTPSGVLVIDRMLASNGQIHQSVLEVLRRTGTMGKG
jgi:myo-inositol-1(or 4)-monophosphatase